MKIPYVPTVLDSENKMLFMKINRPTIALVCDINGTIGLSYMNDFSRLIGWSPCICTMNTDERQVIFMENVIYLYHAIKRRNEYRVFLIRERFGY